VLYVVHVIACYGHAQDIYHDIYHLSFITDITQQSSFITYLITYLCFVVINIIWLSWWYIITFQITESTKTALEKLVATKISAAMPVRAAEKQAPSHFVM